jgi:hypothetical protein
LSSNTKPPDILETFDSVEIFSCSLFGIIATKVEQYIYDLVIDAGPLFSDDIVTWWNMDGGEKKVIPKKKRCCKKNRFLIARTPGMIEMINHGLYLVIVLTQINWCRLWLESRKEEAGV